ncbi:DsbA family protein [Spelaeicoccus albus]|uniref:DsbA family protein n=1 Tax=Spelaeicoccus albus TaxID=1280376 RepID=UPI0015C89698|nr:thioredoxin domain-containing protein [Spelaeicoccus albus]
MRRRGSSASSKRTWLIVVASVAALVLLGSAVWTSHGSGGDDSQAGASEVTGEPSHAQTRTSPNPTKTGRAKSRDTDPGVERRQYADRLALGRADAPVVMIEYADYRCPFCGLFSRDTLPKLKKEYIDTGKVRFEWRDMPIYGEQSENAAIAARAAGRQGKYWAYHNAVYDAAPERGHPTLGRATLVGFAKQVNVPDMAKFKRDLGSSKLARRVRADAEEARSIGASATPTFVIGQTAVPGAQPIKVFRKVIDDELTKAEGK